MFCKKLIKWSPVILCLLLFIGFLRYVIPVVVKGDSMVPNLMENQRLFVLKNRQLDRFDIVVFREEETNKPLIKRVIGLPGETIRYENDILYVDGKKIEEPFLADLKTTLAKHTVLTDDIFETRIPYDAYFVLGDNRKISRDSRLFGIVIQEEVIGEVKFRFWPPNKINRFP